MSQPDFWDAPAEAKNSVNQLKSLKRLIDPWKKSHQEVKDLGELLSIVGDDDASLKELEGDFKKVEREVEMLEFQRLLSGPLDANSAIVSINAGAGGTESCDWAQMLLRMYVRWAENRDFSVQLADSLAGEEAGTKSATFFVRGPYAYGYLKAERGVHRLVRISPFDANKRRHTSFASVDVIAEVEEEMDISVNEKDLRIDTFRAGGAGGQHVNKTSSAVRITHIPTGIVVACQSERSQLQNRALAMNLVRAKLLEKKRAEDLEQKQELKGATQSADFGQQIRSYVLHPYQMVKDLRTDTETSDTTGVLDGDIQQFIDAELKRQASH